MGPEQRTHHIAVVDDRSYTGVDDRLEQRSGTPHPVTSIGEVEVDVIIAHDPGRLGSDLLHQRAVREVPREVRRVRIGVRAEDVVRIVRTEHRTQDFVVAEVLCIRANLVGVRAVALLDLSRSRSGRS